MIFLKRNLPQSLPTWIQNKLLTPNGLFEHVLLCNLDRRQDRMKWSAEQCEKIGIKFERIKAIDGADKEWQKKLSFKVTNEHKLGDSGTAALNETMRTVLIRAITEKWESFLWMEDDITFTDGFLTWFNIGVKKISNDWKIIHGGNFVNDEALNCDKYKNTVIKMARRFNNTHFIAFHNSIFKQYYENLVKSPEYPIDRLYPYDNGYIFVPPIAYQEKTLISDLSQGRYDGYAGLPESNISSLLQ